MFSMATTSKRIGQSWMRRSPRDSDTGNGQWLLQRLLGLSNGFFHDANRAIGLFFINDQRRRHTDGIFARSKCQQSSMESMVYNFVSKVLSALLGVLIAHNFDADH